MTFVETLRCNEQQDEYIKIDPNTDVTWENLGDIICEHTAAMTIKRAKEFTQKTHDGCIEEQGTPQ